MARIVYKPHCSECGALINDEVMYEKIELEALKERGDFIREFINILRPTKCEVCGEYFDCIEITPPTNLTEERI